MLAEQLVALLQERNVLAAHETHVRDRVDEVLRRAEAVLADHVGPELFGNLELGVDVDGFLDIDGAIRRLRGVVQLAETGVTGAGVVPRVGAFDRPGFLQFDDLQVDGGIEFLQQGCKGRTHDAGANQQYIQCFVIVLRH
ncbi:hypothetical protein D9M71_271510 [compost metagenome]